MVLLSSTYTKTIIQIYNFAKGKYAQYQIDQVWLFHIQKWLKENGMVQSHISEV